MAKILLIDVDDITERNLTRLLYDQEHIVEVHIGEPFTEAFANRCDLIILDCCRVGQLDPFIFCQRYRARGGTAPILALTDTRDPEEEEGLLDAGADDCVVRNCQRVELTARINSLLRRPTEVVSSVVKLKDVEIDCSTSRVFRSGREIPLTPKEFNILLLLMRSPNRNFTPEKIMEKLWESTSLSSADTVRTHMKTLRRKLRDFDSSNPLIRTDRGWGYKVVAD